MRRLQASRALGWITAISSFACLAVYTDIFWGWHAYLASDVAAPWNAVLATALWAAGPLFAAVLLAPVARGESGAWRLRAVAIFQLPVAAFNLFMMPEYLHGGLVDVPGLAILMLGLQLQSWACMALTIRRDADTRAAL